MIRLTRRLNEISTNANNCKVQLNFDEFYKGNGAYNWLINFKDIKKNSDGVCIKNYFIKLI